MAPRKQHGSFGDTGLEDDPPKTSARLAKSDDDLTVQDLERMCDAIEILERRAPKLSKAQLFKIQYEAGLMHHRLQKSIFEYITRPRGKQVFEKVSDNSGSMQDAGLDDDRKVEVPTIGTAEKFVKTKKEIDAFGDEIERK